MARELLQQHDWEQLGCLRSGAAAAEGALSKKTIADWCCIKQKRDWAHIALVGREQDRLRQQAMRSASFRNLLLDESSRRYALGREEDACIDRLWSLHFIERRDLSHARLLRGEYTARDDLEGQWRHGQRRLEESEMAHRRAALASIALRRRTAEVADLLDAHLRAEADSRQFLTLGHNERSSIGLYEKKSGLDLGAKSRYSSTVADSLSRGKTHGRNAIVSLEQAVVRQLHEPWS